MIGNHLGQEHCLIRLVNYRAYLIGPPTWFDKAISLYICGNMGVKVDAPVEVHLDETRRACYTCTPY